MTDETAVTERADDIDAKDEWAKKIVATIEKLGDIEQLIVRAGIRGLSNGTLDADSFGKRVSDLIDKHRAGKQVSMQKVFDLYIPGEPKTAPKPETTAA